MQKQQITNTEVVRGPGTSVFRAWYVLSLYLFTCSLTHFQDKASGDINSMSGNLYLSVCVCSLQNCLSWVVDRNKITQ